MLSLIRHRVRPTNTPTSTPPHIRAQGILIYRRRAEVQVPDCCWLTGFAESNGLAGRLLPQEGGGFRALRWRDRGGYVDLGIFENIQLGINAIGATKKV